MMRSYTYHVYAECRISKITTLSIDGVYEMNSMINNVDVYNVLKESVENDFKALNRGYCKHIKSKEIKIKNLSYLGYDNGVDSSTTTTRSE